MPSSRPLGDYLRARRELLQPGEVGLPEGGGLRRVPGLRRSEVALLAGISTEYLVKLEQGQEMNPTTQVLESLSSALRLDATANSYLHTLARLVERPEPAPPTSAVDRYGWLINTWPMTAAMILDRHNDIVALNPLMSALVGSYEVGANGIGVLLLDPSMRALHLDWDGLTKRTIGLLRSQTGPTPDARSQELIEQLTEGSPRFRELWNRHDIAAMNEGTHPVLHPVVGELTLQFMHLPLVRSDNHSMFLYFAEPGTRTERALAELAGR